MRLDTPILQRTATRGNRCRRIVALEKVAGSSPVGHPPRRARGDGLRDLKSWAWGVIPGSPNAIGNAIGALKVNDARIRRTRSFGSGLFADGVKVAYFAEGRMGYRERARPSGKLGGRAAG